jgi:hypothetical protein
MMNRQFDRAIVTGKARPAGAARNLARDGVVHAEHPDPFIGAGRRPSTATDARAQAAALHRATGGRPGRAAPALLQPQRLHGNRHVRRVMSEAALQGGATGASLRAAINGARVAGRPLPGTSTPIWDARSARISVTSGSTRTRRRT